MTDLSQIPEQDWNEARRRADILRSVAGLAPCPRDQARAAAAQLGLSKRQIDPLAPQRGMVTRLQRQHARHLLKSATSRQPPLRPFLVVNIARRSARAPGRAAGAGRTAAGWRGGGDRRGSVPLSSGRAAGRTPARRRDCRGGGRCKTVPLKRVSGTVFDPGNGGPAGRGERTYTAYRAVTPVRRGGDANRASTTCPPRRTRPPRPVFQYGTGDDGVSAKTRSKNLVILYDRLTPEAQQRLIERFVILHPERLVELTTLRSRLADAKLKRRGNSTGTGR